MDPDPGRPKNPTRNTVNGDFGTFWITQTEVLILLDTGQKINLDFININYQSEHIAHKDFKQEIFIGYK